MTTKIVNIPVGKVSRDELIRYMDLMSEAGFHVRGAERFVSDYGRVQVELPKDNPIGTIITRRPQRSTLGRIINHIENM